MNVNSFDRIFFENSFFIELLLKNQQLFKFKIQGEKD